MEVCVTDDDGGTGCDSFTVTVDNALPVVHEPGDVDLSTWRAEHWTHTGHPNTPNWEVASGGLSVVQTRNAPAAVFYGDFPAFGTRTKGRIRVETSRDDDFIGFALGYSPGDVGNPDADFLLLDWKQRDQGDLEAGLAVSRVTGLEPTLNTHEGETIEELARGIRFGETGWQDRREYELTIDFTPSRLRVFIDGVLEIDLVGTFSGGRLAFYNASQQRVRYSAFSVESLVADEGRPLGLSATFGDLGLLDTHTASVDWGDGTIEPAAVDQQSGFGTLTAEHVYPDDAVPGIELCVSDDDGGTGCGSFPARVHNLPPVIEAGGDRLAYTTEGLDVVAPYSDGGLLDTHTATIDWGDGSTSAGAVTEDAGAGTISASHVYGAAGTYTVDVCATDDDEGTGCDSLRVEVIERPPEVSIGDATVDEGDEGPAEARFPLSLAFPAPAPFTVSYATADGTARAGEDFAAASGTVTIPTGAASGSIVVEVAGDRVDELEETFSVRLSADPPIVVVDGEAVGTLVDDDTAALSVDDVTLEEGDAGTTDALFTVRLATEADREIGVSYATVEDSGAEDPGADRATEEDDYLATSGSLVVPVGETAATIPVPVVGDLVDELHESFFVDLSAATPAGEAVLADPTGLGTIRNDDWCPRTRGFWKNHVDAWTVDFLVLGGVEYDVEGVLDLLRSGGPDPSRRLASHLAATQLNLARGGRDRETILPTVEEADAFLEAFPPGSRVKGAERKEANRIKDELDRYNNGNRGQCTDDRAKINGEGMRRAGRWSSTSHARASSRPSAPSPAP